MRKAISILLVLVFLVFGSLGVCAQDIPEAEEYLGNISDMTIQEAAPGLARATTTFSGSIPANAYAYSPSTFYMTANEGYSYSINWEPSGQSVKICRINVSTGNVYGTSAKSGGYASGYVGTSPAPAGQYWFAVYNAGTNVITTFSCSITF